MDNCWFAAQDSNKIPVRKETQDVPKEEGKSHKIHEARTGNNQQHEVSCKV